METYQGLVPVIDLYVPPRMKRPQKSSIVIGLLVIVAVVVVTAFRWVFPPSHQHCMKSAGLFFSLYASDHGGKYPESEKGWGDALLMVMSDQVPQHSVAYLVGVDDDGSRLLDALAKGTDVDEARCTRIYVQGLNKNSHPEIALFFDRDSEPGGDHFRCRYREPLREVLMADGSHQMIKDRDWPEFVEKQRGLLRSLGFSQSRIDEVYGRYQ
jgi:hypothetical protein